MRQICSERKREKFQLRTMYLNNIFILIYTKHSPLYEMYWLVFQSHLVLGCIDTETDIFSCVGRFQRWQQQQQRSSRRGSPAHDLFLLATTFLATPSPIPLAHPPVRQLDLTHVVMRPDYLPSFFKINFIFLSTHYFVISSIFLHHFDGNFTFLFLICM